MRFGRFASVATLVGLVAVAQGLPVSAAAPAIPPPDSTHVIATLTGPGGRGAAFMDYTDDAAMSIAAQVQGLVPGATYRLVGSPTACATPDVRARRLFATTFRANDRGTRWSPGVDVTRRSTATLAAVRVLKGSTQVACGAAVPLTDQTGHPAVHQLAVVARFGGPDRRGLIFAVPVEEGVMQVTIALGDIPGTGSIRARGVSGTCATPLPSATVVLRGRATDVKPRHTAFSDRAVDLQPGAKPGDIDSFRLGGGSGPFTPVRCADTILLGLADV